MTNYLTEPVFEDVFGYDVRETVYVDAWIAADMSNPAQAGWPVLKQLRLVPYGMYLAYEQGMNAPGCVLAWRDQPDIDLANDEAAGYPLRYASDPALETPEVIRRFTEPIDQFIIGMANLLEQETRDDPGGIAPPLITACARQIAGYILARIENVMILRPDVIDHRTAARQPTR
jgi:hypothetical protein